MNCDQMTRRTGDEGPSRREFLAAAAVGMGAASVLTGAEIKTMDKPALLGGKKVRTEAFPKWPVFDQNDEQALIKVLHSGGWFRGYGPMVNQFEEAYARFMGARHCVAVNGGTSALIAAMAAAGVEAGDEVILTPYTFIACVNAIFMLNAVPVFVDTDRETFQLDARKVEAAITGRTRAIMPVHLGGNVVDMDTLLDVAARHNVAVVEDACQAHLAEWKGRRVGSLGTAGCFSFQASKNLNAGEGGAIITSDDRIAERCYSIHTNGRTRNPVGWRNDSQRAANFRLTEFQAALLLTQMARVEEQSKTRERNAQYLSQMLRSIGGLSPAKMHEGTTRNAYHLYMFRYDKEQFAGLSRAAFQRALSAEGIPCSTGYGPMNKQEYIVNTLRSPSFAPVVSKERLARWQEKNQCPENDRLCEEAVWFTQNMLLGPKSDMEQIAEAIGKIKAHAGELANA